MEYTKLANTNIKISRICLGTMTWGSQNSESEGHVQMDYALDQGVNFWDTAEMYAVPPTAESYGSTETIIGTWLKANASKRDDIVLATKISPEMPYIRGGGQNIDRKNILKAIEDSLTRLQTDYVDLYQLHWPSNRPTYHFDHYWTYTPRETDKEAILANQLEVLETLDELVQQGKIRSYGLSDDTAWGITQYSLLAEKHKLKPMVSIQNEYSLLRRRDDTDVAEACVLENISYLPWSPLAMGVLSGKYLNNQKPGGTRFYHSEEGTLRYGYRMTETVHKATESYLAIAQKHGLDPAQMAISFTLTRPFVTSTIIGATSLEQLTTNIDAINVKLTDEVLDEIETVNRQYPIPF